MLHRPKSLLPGFLLCAFVLVLTIYTGSKFLAMLGITCVIVGSLLNALAIVANNGRMPVLATKQEVKEWREEGRGYVRMDANTKLRFLADRFRLHRSFGIFSIGDVVITVGVVLTIWHVIENLILPFISR